MYEVLRCLRLSGTSFAVTVIVCVWLRPGDVLTHNGLSFYGNFHQTFVPYCFGLCLAAYFLLRASRSLVGVVVIQSIRPLLIVMAVALVGVVVTPSFSHSRSVQGLHVLFGTVIFVTQLLVSRQLLCLPTTRLDRWLVRLQVVALLLVLLSFGDEGELAFMLPAQALAVGTFGALLLRAMRRQLMGGDRLAPVRVLPPEKL